ncbi:protein-disulfide reductase DsbD family protein [Kiloniella sp. b19]|uniref:protein-disulfide reductase DsbD family protein n=1 Tax=Kiloniella sp. GXU_MW_B19 TaxID=3141326 RepID=UPI0031D2A0C4
MPVFFRAVKKYQAFVFALLAVLSLSFPDLGVRDARAAASGWQEMDQLSVRLLSDRDALGEGEVVFALEQVLQKGWKTYWRSPGDAGFPLSVDWSGSENVESLEVLWPAPHRFVLFGLQTFGYSDRVVFPLAVKAKDTSRSLTLRLTANYLICEEVCIPYSNAFEMTLQPGKGFQSLEADLVQDALKTVPELQTPGAQSSVASFRSLALQGSDEELVLAGMISIPGESLPDGSDVLVEGPTAFLYSAPEFRPASGGEDLYSFAITVTSTDDRQVLEGKRLTLTYVNDEQKSGTEWAELARFDPDGVTASPLSDRLFEVLLLAVLGGLILNVMPCVLPVLSLKFLSLVNKADRERSEARKGFLVTVSGIMVSFWALALGAILLKVLGLSVGWGIQFQQPVFLAFMALVVVFFAANLFGLFEIGSVGALNDLAVRESQSKGVKGDFATGVFATLLATPCSAPFLGTSVAFALAGGSFEILAIFTALGFGMALPYLLVALFPGLAAVMPKPGMWMVRVKQVMGLALIVTAVWLLSVVWVQSGAMVTVLIALALAALLVVLWALRYKTQAKWAMVALVSVFTLAIPLGSASTVPAPIALEENWTVFDEQQISRLVAEGRTVFVDVTADWCITCQVNKRLVLSDDQVQQAFETGDVVLMKADWTNPDPVISDYLKVNGRYGIPFNIVYGPSSAEGIALSEILSVDEVLDALQTAEKPDA